jgi:hypothetical protein
MMRFDKGHPVAVKREFVPQNYWCSVGNRASTSRFESKGSAPSRAMVDSVDPGDDHSSAPDGPLGECKTCPNTFWLPIISEAFERGEHQLQLAEHFYLSVFHVGTRTLREDHALFRLLFVQTVANM